LSSFGKAGVQPEIQQLLSSFSAKAKTQNERLTAVLESRGGSPSAAKTVLAEMLAFTPLSAQIVTNTSLRVTCCTSTSSVWCASSGHRTASPATAEIASRASVPSSFLCGYR
jgi:hypothetical protein